MSIYFTDENIGDDLLSRSYAEGIRKISDTRDSCFDFQISKEVLEVRKRNWNKFFDKYLEKMSDEIEYNVNTLGLVKINDEDYNNEHRVPISTRKPPALIEGWIKTGYLRYNAVVNKNYQSDTGSSLSEKSFRIVTDSSAVIEANKSMNQKQKSHSSSSSVNTAKYIFANGKVTNKSDTMAVIRDAKCDNALISKNVCINNTGDTYDARLDCTKTLKSHIIRNNNSNDDAQRSNAIKRFIPVQHVTLKTNSQTSIDAISTNILQRSSENLSVISDMSTSQQIDSWVEAVSDVRNADSLNREKISGKHTSDTLQVLANSTEIENISFSQSSSRKRLYTGRDSPVDLIVTERSNINRLSEINQYLHPALNSPYIVERKTSLVNKNKNKYSSLKHKKDLSFNKDKMKKRKCIAAFNKNITNIDDKVIVANNNKISDSTHNSSRNLSDSNNILYKRDNDTTSTEYNNINTARNKITEYNLLSPNLNPVVLLERIPTFLLPSTLKQHESARYEHCVGRSNTNNSDKLYSCQIECLESDAADSDGSTIIICQSRDNIVESDEAISNYCFHETLNSKNDSSSAEKKDSSSNLKDVVINKAAIVLLERLLINKDCGNANIDAKMFNKNDTIHNKDYGNANIDVKMFNKNDTIHETKILNKSDICSSNLNNSRKKDNVKLREIKIILEPVDINFKRGNNVVNVSSNKISCHKGVDNNEKKSINETKVSHKGVRSSNLKSSYLLRKDTRKSANESSCTTNSSVSFFDDVELKSIVQRKNNQVKNKHNKHLIMNSIVLLNEDNFVELIKKNSSNNTENLKNGNALDETSTVENTFCNKAESFNINNDKYHHNRNKNIDTDSPREVKSIKINRSVTDQTRRSKRKSVGNSTSTSLHKKIRFSILSSESDSSTAEKLGKQKKQSSLLHRNKNTNNIKTRSSKDIRKDTTNHENNNNMLCQTNIFNKDSLSSEGSTIDNTSKVLKPFVHSTVCHNPSNKIRFSILSCESDDSSIAEKLREQKKRSSLLYRNKNKNYNIKTRSSKDIRKNTKNHKNNNNMLCQTNIFTKDSSSFEESTIDNTAISKSLQPSVHNTVCHNRSNKIRFSILSGESDDSSIAEKLDEQKKRSSLLYRNKNMNNNIKTRSNKNMRKDTTNHKNNNNVFCQTNIFNIDSSSSEENIIDKTATSKDFKPSMHNTICHNRSNKKTCFNNPIGRNPIVKLSVLSSSSDENNKVIKHKYNRPTKSRELVTSKLERNGQKEQNKEEINYHIKLNTNNATTENMFSFSSINNISRVRAQKDDDAIINTSNETDNLDSLSESEHTSKQSTKFVKNYSKCWKSLRLRRINSTDSDLSESL